MDTLLVTPKSVAEFDFLKSLLDKLKFKTKVISETEKEDFAMSEIMKNIDRTEKVTKEEIMSILN
jgi:hypothetical protein